jgi:adenine-specific DNA-methyltransferase
VIGRNPDGSLVVGDVETDEVRAVPSTQWHVSSHDATQYGSRLLECFVPGRKFPFPKSLYAVEDTLRFFVGDKTDALVVDFFAGSGTTAHAVMRLNRQDEGHRRSITVTNNEVSEGEARELRRKGSKPCDPEWEALGIFHYVTRPRVTAAITGRTPEGDKITGEYRFVDEFPMSEGFEENVEFLRLDYLDAEKVELGELFDRIHPLLWLAAGARGERPDVEPGVPFLITEDCGYAVLLKEDAFPEFSEALTGTSGITHVFLATDSEEAYTEMCEEVGGERETMMLYRDFLQHYRRMSV